MGRLLPPRQDPVAVMAELWRMSATELAAGSPRQGTATDQPTPAWTLQETGQRSVVTAISSVPKAAPPGWQPRRSSIPARRLTGAQQIMIAAHSCGSACVIHSLCCPVGGRPAAPRERAIPRANVDRLQATPSYARGTAHDLP